MAKAKGPALPEELVPPEIRYRKCEVHAPVGKFTHHLLSASSDRRHRDRLRAWRSLEANSEEDSLSRANPHKPESVIDRGVCGVPECRVVLQDDVQDASLSQRFPCNLHDPLSHSQAEEPTQ